MKMTAQEGFEAAAQLLACRRRTAFSLDDVKGVIIIEATLKTANAAEDGVEPTKRL
jgi:hypothetical protein